LFALYIGGGTSTAVLAAACNAPGSGTTYNTPGNCDYIIISGDYTGSADVVVDVADTITGPPFDGPTVLLPFGTHFQTNAVTPIIAGGTPSITHNGFFGIVNATTGITIAGSVTNNGVINVSNGTTIDLAASDVVIGIGGVGMDIDGFGIRNNGTINVLA
jgi:hypothetical protein